MSENFADRKAEAAALFEALEPLFGKAAILKAARDHADEKALPYPPTLKQGIRELRTLLLGAGLPQAEVDELDGLAPFE